jgi:hypothetical protein
MKEKRHSLKMVISGYAGIVFGFFCTKLNGRFGSERMRRNR